MSIPAVERASFRPLSAQFALAATLSVLPGFLSLNIAPVIPIMLDRYGIDRGQAGLAVSATLVVHAAMLLPGGMLVDRLGIRRAMLLAAGFGALGSVLTAFAVTFPWLIVGRLLTGLGTGLAFPGPLRLVAMSSSPQATSTNQGVIGAFAFVGMIAATFLPVPGVVGAGWGFFFLAVAGFCAVVGVFSLLVGTDATASPASVATPWRTTFTDGRAIALGCVHLTSYGLVTGIHPWAVDYLTSTFDVPLVTAAAFAALAASGGMFGRVLGGLLARPLGPGRVILLGLLATLVVILAFAAAHTFGLAVAMLLLLGIIGSTAFGPVFELLARPPGGSSARRMALVILVGNFGALSLPTIIGFAVARTGSFATGFLAAFAVGAAVNAFLILGSPIRGELR